MIAPISYCIDTRKDWSRLIKLGIFILIVFAVCWFGLGVIVGSLAG